MGVELNFQNRGLKLETAEDGEELLNLFDDNATYEIIKIGGNTISVDFAEVFSDKLAQQKHLKHLLWSDIFTGRLKTEIPIALDYFCHGVMKSGSQIVELDLSDNAFGPAGIKALRPFFEHEASNSLKILKFNNNGMGIEGGKVLSEYLKACVKRCQTNHQSNQKFALQEFYAGRNRLENRGAKALAEAFKLIHTLEVVSVPQNGIYHEGISALSESFTCNPNLIHINLNDNTATAIGAFSLSKALINLPKLEILNVGDCLLRDKGACHISHALSHAKCLQELYLNNNEINCQAALHIIEDLQNVSSLTYLDLNGNYFGSGVSIIKDQLIESGKGHIISSLSDDEGSADGDSEHSSYEHISNVSSGDSGSESDIDENELEDGEYEEEGESNSTEDNESPITDDLIKLDRINLESSSYEQIGDNMIKAADDKIDVATKDKNLENQQTDDITKSKPGFSFTAKSLAEKLTTTITSGSGFGGFNFVGTPKFSFAMSMPKSDSIFQKLQTKTIDNKESEVPIDFTFNPNIKPKTTIPDNKNIKTQNNITNGSITPNKMESGEKRQNLDELLKVYGQQTMSLDKCLEQSLNITPVQKSPIATNVAKMKTVESYSQDFENLFNEYLKNTENAERCGDMFVKMVSRNEPMEVIDAFMKSLFTQEYNRNEMITSLLSYIGLMKNEDKSVKKPDSSTQKACINTLLTITEKPYVDSNIKSMIRTFINFRTNTASNTH